VTAKDNWSLAYKALYIPERDSFDWSDFHYGSLVAQGRYEKKYRYELTTRAPKGTKLYVFATHLHAQAYLRRCVPDSWKPRVVLFQVEALNLNTDPDMIPITSIAFRWAASKTEIASNIFWMKHLWKQQVPGRIAQNVSSVSPDGTGICDAVRLLGQVNWRPDK